MRAYFRMISGIDHAIGRVLAELERHGLADNTIIVYSADNGYYMGDRGFAGKWSHYEESLRVPSIVFDPRLPAARRRGRVGDPAYGELSTCPRRSSIGRHRRARIPRPEPRPLIEGAAP